MTPWRDIIIGAAMGLGFIAAAYYGINVFCDWVDDEDDDATD